MKLVVDANIIIAAFIRNSKVRQMLFKPGHTFYAPEFLREEVEAHFHEILEKSGLTRDSGETILHLIFGRIAFIPSHKFASHLAAAERMMRQIDLEDAPYVALALAIRNDGIWSDDPHFQNLKGRVRAWRTADLVPLL